MSELGADGAVRVHQQQPQQPQQPWDVKAHQQSASPSPPLPAGSPELAGSRVFTTSPPFQRYPPPRRPLPGEQTRITEEPPQQQQSVPSDVHQLDGRSLTPALAQQPAPSPSPPINMAATWGQTADARIHEAPGGTVRY